MRNERPAIKRIVQAISCIFPHMTQLHIEPILEGVSTYVYRIHYANDIFYLRVLPEMNASFAPEVAVHKLLRDKHVKVPDILYFEHYNALLEQSIMVTTEIKGEHFGHCSTAQEQRNILIEAGQDLAIINSIPIKHFGWIRRDSAEPASLEAEHSSYRSFVEEFLESDLALLATEALNPSTITAIRAIIYRFDSWLDGEQAWLAHGDFDVTHIYQAQGHYTGIIDFGEIRGTNKLYDLGHFRLHDGETLTSLVLPYLLEGYQKITPLPADYEQKIAFSSLLIAIRTLVRIIRKSPNLLYRQHTLQAIERDIQTLLV